jgi:hypothetical protein
MPGMLIDPLRRVVPQLDISLARALFKNIQLTYKNISSTLKQEGVKINSETVRSYLDTAVGRLEGFLHFDKLNTFSATDPDEAFIGCLPDNTTSFKMVEFVVRSGIKDLLFYKHLILKEIKAKARRK